MKNNNTSKWFLTGCLVLFSLPFLINCGQGSGSGDMGANGKTLKAIKERDSLLCGVSTGLAGFSSSDSSGDWRGIDVDFCKAVAAAVLGDAEKVTYIVLTAKERFTALQSGEVDILSRNSTWSITKDTSLGLSFIGVVYYDGAGFLVKTKDNIKNLKNLNGATLCIQAGTTTELNVADYFTKNTLKYTPITFESMQQTLEAFRDGRCDSIVADKSQLVALRSTLPAGDQGMAEVLDEMISKEPLGPVVRQGDGQWFNIARWTLFAMIAAEEYGITSDNVDVIRNNTSSPEIERLLGVEGRSGSNLGIDKYWSYNIIRQVGNYGESYERNLGKNSPLKLKRGMNNLWNKGGLHYSMPFR